MTTRSLTRKERRSGLARMRREWMAQNRGRDQKAIALLNREYGWDEARCLAYLSGRPGMKVSPRVRGQLERLGVRALPSEGALIQELRVKHYREHGVDPCAGALRAAG